MNISVTVPRGLTNISNGRLLRKVELPENQTRFDWHVSYPITPYAVALNIGDYVQIVDWYITGRDTLILHEYSLAHDAPVLTKIFRHVKPMLAFYEKSFGPYPFRRDGFTVMQSVYPMEHQSAVSIGSVFSPFNSDRYDSLEAIRLMWHEVAHEWWGNSVTVEDMADLWIHEAFATYAEVMAYEALSGGSARDKYLKEQVPGNHTPILGTYGVNDFHLGDMYSKGALLLHTLRNVIDDDVVWFDLLKSIQKHFQYSTVTTRSLIAFVNEKLKGDYTGFFEQYVARVSIPVLEVRFAKENSVLKISYRWWTEAKAFNMPVKVTTAPNVFKSIYPTQAWQELVLPGMNAKDFKVATDRFYVKVDRKVNKEQ